MNAPARLSAPLDLHDHLTRLDERKLLVRIDRPINKDTELHPLVRWQFVGGLPEEARRAFLFTNVIGARGERYDIPVVVGALAASTEIYALGMGVPVGELGNVWLRALANPIAPVQVSDAPCQEIVLTGDDITKAGRRPRAVAGADLDARLRCRALSHRHGLRDQKSRNRYAKSRHLSRRAEKQRPARRAHGLAARRRRRLPALAAISKARRADAVRHRDRLSAGGCLYRPAENFPRPGRDGDRRRTGRPAHADGPRQDRRSRRPRRRRDRHRGIDRYRTAGAGGTVRREPRPCGAGRLQHVDAGDGDHPAAQGDLRLHHQRGDAERIERAEEVRL